MRALLKAPAPTVAWRRDASGVLASISLTLAAESISIEGEDLERLLRDAQERAGADPYSEHLPPDWAVIEAAMESH